MAVDLSTPDRALRSYWRLQDLDLSEWDVPDTTSVTARNYRRYGVAQIGLLGGDALAERKDTTGNIDGYQYAREIVDIKQESESRSVVLARIRNVTPIPPGATPDNYDIEARQKGRLIRYIFEKDEAGWKLVQIQTEIGDQWHNYHDPTPRVPTYVSP